MKHNSMEVYEEVEEYLHAFWTLTVNGGEWSACRSGHFTAV
jgi:hypothetical protein